MRHFRSILYALVLAPVLWVLVAVGLTHDLTARGRDGFAVESPTGLVLVLLGGAAYGILVFAPISPLGPVVAGVVFLVLGAWAAEWPAGYAGLWPSGVVKDGFDLSRPGYGLAALLSVPLILTVLSVRRWAGFEPMVLPIIGPVGRARGAAAGAGTPVAVMQAAVPAPPADAFLANAFDERTTLIRMPGADLPQEATTVLNRPAADDGEATTVLRAPAVVDESATEDVVAGHDEPTDAIAEEQATEDDANDEATVVVAEVAEPIEAAVGEPAGRAEAVDDPAEAEPVTTVPATAESDQPAADEPVTSLVLTDEQQPAGDEAADHDEHDDEHPDDDETSGASSPAPGDSDESADDWVPASAAVTDDARADVVEETTYLLMPADDDARTQALRLAAELENDGARTQVIRPVGYEPGQTTHDLGTPGDRTQVIWPSAHRVPGETTQVIGLPGEKTRRIVRSGEKVAGLDETQLIRLPDPADDGARTQVIRSGHVTPPSEHLQPHPVTPPGDDTELTLAMPRVETTPPGEPTLVTSPPNGVKPVRVPHQRVDSGHLPDGAEEPAEPDEPPSIARAESPNFAEDPTGRIVSPVLPPDEPTRTMTVMNIERPPDEVPEIPAQRQPSADE